MPTTFISMMDEFLVSGDAKPILTDTPPVLLISEETNVSYRIARSFSDLDWPLRTQRSMKIHSSASPTLILYLPLINGLDRHFDFLVAIDCVVGIFPCFTFKCQCCATGCNFGQIKWSFHLIPCPQKLQWNMFRLAFDAKTFDRLQNFIFFSF